MDNRPPENYDDGKPYDINAGGVPPINDTYGYNSSYGYNPYGGYQQQPPSQQTPIDNRLDAKQVEEIWDGRRRIAWVALIAIIIPTLYIIGFVTDIELVRELGDLMTWFYVSLASIVCAFFGFSSWATVKGR